MTNHVLYYWVETRSVNAKNTDDTHINKGNLGGNRKKCRKERVGPVAANQDNLERNTQGSKGGNTRCTRGFSKNYASRESVSPLSRLIRDFRNNKYH